MNRMLRRAAVATTTIAAAVLLLTGCATSGIAPMPSTAASASDRPQLSGELTVFAAASLSGAFDRLAADFAADHPGLTVKPITYDGSSVLAKQLIEGAKADVFASADRKNMTKVIDAKLAARATPFATNVLEIAVAPGDPLAIRSLADLADGATVANGTHPVTVLCAKEVPCGNAARTLIAKAGLTLTPASEEQNVSAVLAKVKHGEADAGLVYVTDVKAAKGTIDGVEIPGADAATNVYPAAALTGAANPDAAAAFVEYLNSPHGREVLQRFGFGAP